MLSVSQFASGQIDVAKEGFSIKASDSNYKADFSYSFKLSPVRGLSNKTIQPRINYTPIADSFKKKSGVNISQKSTLQKPTWNIKQPFIEDKQDVSQFNKDYYLGDVKTKSKTIVIKCRDHEYVDGDRIKLMLNDAVIHPNLTLSGDFYSIDVDLKEGFNTVNFIALNEGLSRPNTAQLRVYDEDGKLLASNKWLITTGYKASLIVLKE
ncbi:MAG: hypothetical protein KJO41_02515 [Bacteroidia bacterium]|nr:hypothetical protein [Bacteroidia bacterium]NND24753.1 hypothetical protein [Flavobacteriaceae bacterium]MBT8277848.1 hypothetical protein [Bacteroidia bacterium]NNK59068.1 hypothetical protein [Flavobacteriaceae bacterium]NNL32505.1 hypothetical protein [Flavobacteriaceae bacterium]